MLARLAENMYWAGRYVERAENTARLLDVTYHGLLESPPAEEASAWADLLAVLTLEVEFASAPRDHTARTVTRFLVADPANPGSIRSSVAAARENVRSLREEVSTELWEAVNGFYLELAGLDLVGEALRQPYVLYGLVRRQCQAISGVADETMPRRDGWRFLVLGRQVERVIMTMRLLTVYFGQSAVADTSLAFHSWVGVLKSAAALEAFRRAENVRVDPVGAVEYLLTDVHFPRSVLFCLREAEELVDELGDERVGIDTRRLLGRLRSSVEYCDLDALASGDLVSFGDRLQEGFTLLHETVAAEFFRPALQRRLRVLGRV